MPLGLVHRSVLSSPTETLVSQRFFSNALLQIPRRASPGTCLNLTPRAVNGCRPSSWLDQVMCDHFCIINPPAVLTLQIPCLTLQLCTKLRVP